MAALTRYSNFELLGLPDCDGLLENGKCRWTKTPCSGARCHRGENSLERAYARLRTLSEDSQAYIARKYYFGGRPWRKEE